MFGISKFEPILFFFFKLLFLFICSVGRFQKFDYGPLKNMKLYNSTKPPEYNLSNVQTKVHIIFGTNDNLVVPEVCITSFKRWINIVIL